MLRKAARATGVEVMRELKNPGFFRGDEVWMLRRGVMAERIDDDLEVSSGRRCARARAAPVRIVKVNDMVALFVRSLVYVARMYGREKTNEKKDRCRKRVR